jgi:hypothetical protein
LSCATSERLDPSQVHSIDQSLNHPITQWLNHPMTRWPMIEFMP